MVLAAAAEHFQSRAFKVLPLVYYCSSQCLYFETRTGFQMDSADIRRHCRALSA